MLYRDLRYTKLPRVLRMHDRLSMASSCELRVPYLDHRLVEFCFRLPAEARLDRGMNKVLLRHSLRGRLDDDLRLAPKRMVVNPQREWFRGVLRDRILEKLHDSSSPCRAFFDQPALIAEFTRFCAGEGDNSFFVWQWLNADAWFRRFMAARYNTATAAPPALEVGSRRCDGLRIATSQG
jgi:asparagine synthase (glutamine-hydrolysing)